MDKEFYDSITQEGKFYLKAYITSDVDHKKHQPFWSGNKRGWGFSQIPTTLKKRTVPILSTSISQMKKAILTTELSPN